VVFQSHQSQQLQDCFFNHFSVLAMEAKCDIFSNIEVGEQGIVLKNHADMALFRWGSSAGIAQALAIEENFTAFNIMQSGDGPECRCLAAATGAEQADNLFFFDTEAQVVDDNLVIIATMDVLECQQCIHGKVTSYQCNEPGQTLLVYK